MDVPAIRPRQRITTKPLSFTAGILCILLTVGRSFAGAPAVPIEPCSLLTLAEVGAVLHGTATQDRPHVVAINKVPVGGNCVYRSAQNKLIVINLMVDANPTGHQQKAFDMGRQRPHTADLAGLGDRAFTVTNPNGPPSVTFLRGIILVTINAQGLGINDVKQLASIAAGRLPATGGGPAVPKSPSPSASSVPTSPSSSRPAMQGSGKLDPALVGSWFMKQPSGLGIANLYIERDGRFSMTILAGNKQQSGKIDGDNGVLHLYPDRGGHIQELKYKIIDKNQMEWTDQKGNVTIARRQFR
jgi:hypothetical protein